MLITSELTSRRMMMSSDKDFIAGEDIFIDRNGKVVEKKDAVTKLASKGARVSPADVEKYGLGPAPKDKPQRAEAGSSAPKVEDTAPPAGEKTRGIKKGKE